MGTRTSATGTMSPSMRSLSDALPLTRGPALNNRLVLAPLTNMQSHPDGRLSDEEYRWLTMRAGGGFGLTMTCAATVQREGVGFPGQLGIYGDEHLDGLSRLAAGIKAHQQSRRRAAAPCRHANATGAERPRPAVSVGRCDRRGQRRCPTSKWRRRWRRSSPRRGEPIGPASTASNCTAPTATSSASS